MIRFRSKSEEIVCDYLKESGIPIRYEESKVDYVWKEYKTYTPDFYYLMELF